MSTRSYIARANDDGSMDVIYCHFDGYPEHHWPILTQCYNTKEKVDELIALGDISILGRTIGEKVDFASSHNDAQCVSYRRDRGEVKAIGKRYKSMWQLERAVERSWVEWVYVWAKGEWHCSCNPTADWLQSLGDNA